MKVQTELSAQVIFLKQIEDLIPESTSLVNELSDLFDISIDSAYRRIRGETSLTFNEISLICNTFKLSFDSFVGSEINSVTFSYNNNVNSKGDFISYLKMIADNIQIINKIPEAELYYAAEDIPVFQYYCNPKLTAFKVFYWMKSVMNIPEYENTRFSESLIDEEIIELCKEIYMNYQKIPSTEIWTELTINSMLKQIQFYWESDYFETKMEAITVCNSLLDEINNVKIQAEKSTKFSNEGDLANYEGNYKLYLSEVEIGNNCILVKLPESKSVYITHFTFNLISTSNAKFSDETEQWFNNLIKKSVLVSGVSEKQRIQYFSKVIRSIEKLKNKIEEE